MDKNHETNHDKTNRQTDRQTDRQNNFPFVSKTIIMMTKYRKKKFMKNNV